MSVSLELKFTIRLPKDVIATIIFFYIWIKLSYTFVSFLVQLVGSEVPGEGTVEILYEDSWGTVCDDLWDDVAASVVCRMLGYEEGGMAFGNAVFGEGQGFILLDSVLCTGNETELADCRHDGWYRSDCTHEEDAGVRCCELMSTFRIRSRHGSAFRIAGPLWGESTGHRWIPLTEDQQCRAVAFSLMCPWTNRWITAKLPIVWDAMPFTWRYYNV